MQTLNTMQTDMITGGAVGETDSVEPEKLKDDGSSGNGSYGSTVAGVIVASPFVIGGALPGVPGKIVAAVGTAASIGFNLAREGRDGMRVQNHPATRHLYNADGTKN